MRLFITTEQQRLMYARAATHNLGSRKVLERTGFTRVGGEISRAAAIGEDVSEFIYRLD